MKAHTDTQAIDTRRWLRQVLRADVVPLATVMQRARMEGVDMQELWLAIREGCIQQDGMGGQRYLKLPHTVWNLPKPAPEEEEGEPDHQALAEAAKAAMARLRLSGDDRIVCQACTHCTGPRCPGGIPTPDLQPTRCTLFKPSIQTEVQP
jgi:hypothetical protein